MRVKPFIIQCTSRAQTRSVLSHLRKLGYAPGLGQYDSWADEYPTFWTIAIHGQGHALNTRASIALMHQEMPSTIGATVFPSARHFLTSNRNVSMTGEPHAKHFV